MKLNDYIDKYGSMTFDEKEFNEVDNIIFSILAYGDYTGIISPTSFNKKTIHEVANNFFSINNDRKELEKNILAVRGGFELLDLVRNAKRFRNIQVFNYKRKITETEQFSALTFKIKKGLIYVAYEGTDEYLSGWQEDMMMSYKYPVEAHTDAINYINSTLTIGVSKIIIGGHSKGGNLALVAAMHANSFIKSRIINVYSNDGQGLQETEFASKEYKSIKDKFIHIIPNYSLVGLLLRSDNDYLVVKSSKSNIMAHDAFTWVIEDDHFEKAKLSTFSKIIDEGFDEWLDCYDTKDREKLTNHIFKLFKDNNITKLNDITKDRTRFYNLLKSSASLDKDVSKMLTHLIGILNKANIEHYSDVIVNEAKHIEKLFKKLINKNA